MNSNYKDHSNLLRPDAKNIYIVKAKYIRPRDIDATSSIRTELEKVVMRHGRYYSSERHFFYQSILHVSDISDQIDLIGRTLEYYGVIFLSNVQNGTEVYFKPHISERFRGAFPWAQNNIVLPISKLMEVGDEMFSYPKMNQDIHAFLERYEHCVNQGNTYGERHDSTPYFNSRLRASYHEAPRYTRFSDEYYAEYPSVARRRSSNPFTD